MGSIVGILLNMERRQLTDHIGDYKRRDGQFVPMRYNPSPVPDSALNKKWYSSSKLDTYWLNVRVSVPLLGTDVAL